jgi:hypothetical protein
MGTREKGNRQRATGNGQRAMEHEVEDLTILEE